MKLLIVSDSHGRVSNLITAVEREKPDRVFHLGDMLSDAQRLEMAVPGLVVEQVRGNCDGWVPGDDVRILTVEKVRFLLTHGHRYHAKLGLGGLAAAGREEHVDVVLFGHTHEAMEELAPGGIWLINPGTAGGVGAPAGYAVIVVANGDFRCSLKRL